MRETASTGRRVPMGEENCENQARSRRGRGLGDTHVTNNVGEATRGKGQ